MEFAPEEESDFTAAQFCGHSVSNSHRSNQATAAHASVQLSAKRIARLLLARLQEYDGARNLFYRHR
jgi:hypothetical protein